MNTHSAAQLIGGRSHQCDATATYTHQERRAYALLDGIGSTEEVQTWTRTAARRLARAAARNGALEGLRQIHTARAAELAPEGWYAQYMPTAVAVVAVAEPGKPLEVAWCGDARAYLLPETGSQLERLTTDHNMRQVLIDMELEPGPYARNRVTSYLGDTSPHPSIGSVRAPNNGRLVLVSDGAYEPLEDAQLPIPDYLMGRPHRAARALVSAAIAHADGRADNATALIADLAAN
ncbi:PP2C family protein-serine/threonine phosphatase [Streptomyces racemochromogenes]|uniref:PP2C family protein-serine/threonine phosphatase n=2 Tax=Streptomyces racemochromogenes TaxID=67353 RepID=UPI0035ECE5FB